MFHYFEKTMIIKTEKLRRESKHEIAAMMEGESGWQDPAKYA